VKDDPTVPIPPSLITFYLDGKKIEAGKGSLTAKTTVDNVELTFSVPQEVQGDYFLKKKSSLTISTKGISKQFLVSDISQPKNGEFPLVLTNTITLGAAVQFYIGDTPFTVRYQEKKSDGKHLFIIAFEHLSFDKVVTASSKNYFSAEDNGPYITKAMTDNFWNKFDLSLAVVKYEVINGFPLVTFDLFGKHVIKAEVINSFQGMTGPTGQVWGALDFSDPAAGQKQKYGNSKGGLTPRIYGPMKVGSYQYYIAQTQDLWYD